MRSPTFFRRIFSVFFFSILVSSLIQHTYAASDTLTVTRGPVTASTLSWEKVNGSSGCTKTTQYNDAVDGIRFNWLTNTTDSTGYITITQADNVGTFTFTCTDKNDPSVFDNATLIVNDCGAGTQWNSSSRTCVAVYPDLTAGSVTPTSSLASAAITYSSTITNGGTASTVSGFTNLFQIATNSSGTDASSVGTQSMTAKAAGATGTFTVSTTAPATPGTYYVRACADKSSAADTGTINEGSGESNNCSAWTAVTVTANTCTSPWGGAAIASGSSITAWQASSATTPTTCTSQTRTCSNGTLSGTYTNQSCAQFYRVTASATNCSISPSGITTVASGGSQAYTITPSSGYGISALTIDGSSVTPASSYTFSNITADHTIAATCAQYTITASSGTGGSISPTGTTYVAHGGSQTYTVTTNAGYVATLSVDGSVVTPSSGYTFSNVTGGHTISVTFSATACTNGASDAPACTPVCGTANGTPQLTEPTTSPTSCNPGTYSNSPSDTTTSGAQAWNWSCTTTGTASNASCSAPKYGCRITTDSNYTLPQYGATGPNNNYGCASTCANGATNYSTCSTYTITATQASNGTISPTGATTVAYGGSRAYTITASSGYSIASLIIDGVTTTAASSYTFSNVTANHTISATFSANAVNCSAQTVTWGSCTGTAGATNTGNNASVTDSTTPNTGSATYACSNGTFTLQSGSTCVAPPTITFSASPTSVTTGATSTLTRTVSGTVTSCSIDQGVGSVSAANGTTVVTVTTTTTYTLTCTGTGGTSTASATVTATAPQSDLTAGAITPTTATAGTPVTLTATISNTGAASTGASFYNFIQVATAINGGGTITDLASSSMTTLASGANNTTSRSHTFSSAGTYSARACADKGNSASSGTITESNENNNCGAWTTVTVAAVPPATGTLTMPSTCVIPSSSASCPATVSWTTTNATATVTVGRDYDNNSVIPGGTGTSGSTNVNFSPVGSYTLNLRHDGRTLDSKTIVASCETNSNWNGDVCAEDPPAVENAVLLNNNSNPGTLQFYCTNATMYSIIRAEGAISPFNIIDQPYVEPGPVTQQVTVAGSYSLVCKNAAESATVIKTYNSSPEAVNLSINANPRTAKFGSVSTLTWSVDNPPQSAPFCAITASAVCAGGTCVSPRDDVRIDDAEELTDEFAGGARTDNNDPYGANRLISAALKTPSTRASGKKTVLLQYTTDFTLTCGTKVEKVRIQVSNDNEG